MSLRELLRRVTPGRSVDLDRIDPGHLRSEIVRHYKEERLDEAAAAARRLIDWQRETLGESHPDHATGLINLALLLQKQGDRKNAHPLVAQALAIRLQALGPAHPDVQASRRLLESLGEVQVGRDEPLPGPTGAEREPIREDSPVAAGKVAPPSPPSDRAALENCAASHREKRTPDVSRSPLESAWETRRSALGVLDWVLALAPRDGADISVLEDVRTRARSLRAAIAAAPLAELPLEAHPLAEGNHALAMLLRLAALREALSDDSWDDLRSAVTAHFGKALWGAVARGRIVFHEPSSV